MKPDVTENLSRRTFESICFFVVDCLVRQFSGRVRYQRISRANDEEQAQADSAPAGTGESWAHMSLSAVLGGRYSA